MLLVLLVCQLSPCLETLILLSYNLGFYGFHFSNSLVILLTLICVFYLFIFFLVGIVCFILLTYICWFDILMLVMMSQSLKVYTASPLCSIYLIVNQQHRSVLIHLSRSLHLSVMWEEANAVQKFHHWYQREPSASMSFFLALKQSRFFSLLFKEPVFFRTPALEFGIGACISGKIF